MRDLEIAKSLLRSKNKTLVIVKRARVLFETSSSGIIGLLDAVEKLGETMSDSSVADKIVGEAAAQLCAYSRVAEVYAITLSQCGKDLLVRHHISYQYENMVPHILNAKKTDLCPFEKVVAGSWNPEEAYEKLRRSVQPLP